MARKTSQLNPCTAVFFSALADAPERVRQHGVSGGEPGKNGSRADNAPECTRRSGVSGRLHVRKAGIFALFLTLFFLLALSAHVRAGDGTTAFPVQKASADVQIKSDNTVQITETLYFTYEGDELAIALDINDPLEGDVTFLSMKKARIVSGQVEDVVNILPRNAARPQPLSFSLIRKDRGARIIVHMTSLTGTFALQFSYQWNRGVVEKNGRALISGPLCSAADGTKVSNIIWKIALPPSGKIDGARIIPVTAHAPTQNKVDENTVTYVDSRDFVKRDGIGFVISMPPDLFPLIYAAEETTPDETALFEQAKKRRADLQRLESLRENSVPIIAILCAAAVLIFLLLHLRNVRTPRSRKFRPDYSYWPATAPPAYIAMLQHFNVRDSDILLSTLMSLTAKKEIRFMDEIFIWNHPERNDFSKFTLWETLLLQWLFEKNPQYDHVLAAERLRVAARQPGFREIAHSFRKALKTSFMNSDLVNAPLTLIFRFASFLFAFLLTAAGLFFYSLTGVYWAFLLLAVAAVFFANGLSFYFLSRNGAQRRWETRHFTKNLLKPEKLMLSCQSRLTDIETGITTLPASIALRQTAVYFQGIKSLPDDQFRRVVYGILHVYRDVAIPENMHRHATPAERGMLLDDLSNMERMLQAWNALLKSCLI